MSKLIAIDLVNVISVIDGNYDVVIGRIQQQYDNQKYKKTFILFYIDKMK